jgi:hypothetical protein
VNRFAIHVGLAQTFVVFELTALENEPLPLDGYVLKCFEEFDFSFLCKIFGFCFTNEPEIFSLNCLTVYWKVRVFESDLKN